MSSHLCSDIIILLSLSQSNWDHFSGLPSMAPLSAVSVDTRFTIGLRALASWKNRGNWFPDMGCKACQIHWLMEEISPWSCHFGDIPFSDLFRPTYLGFPETNRWQLTILRDTSSQHGEKSIETTHVEVQESLPQMLVTCKPTTLLLMHSMPFFWYLFEQTLVRKELTKAPWLKIRKTSKDWYYYLESSGTTWRAIIDKCEKWYLYTYLYPAKPVKQHRLTVRFCFRHFTY